MKFSFPAFLTIVLAVSISGIASFLEGTFTNKKVTMGFLNHGGMWSDLIVLSAVTGLVFPYLLRSQLYIFLSLTIAMIITVIAHIQWAKWMQNDAITGHVFPTHKTGIWYLDMSVAGWLHVAVMTALLAILLMYAISPLPKKVILVVSILLTLHIFLGMVQPSWYSTGNLWTWKNFGQPLFVTTLIWSIALVKMQFAKANF